MTVCTARMLPEAQASLVLQNDTKLVSQDGILDIMP